MTKEEFRKEFYSNLNDSTKRAVDLFDLAYSKIEAKDEEMNGLIEIHHEQCKELELEIQSLTEQLQKAEEKLKQYNQNEV